MKIVRLNQTTLFLFILIPLSVISAEDNLKWQSRDYAKSFTVTADSVLAPVYPYFADFLVDNYRLGNKQGVGIDIGGGPGNLVVELAARTAGMRWICADINRYFFPTVIDKARNAGVESRVDTVQADAVSLPFPDEYARFIVSRGSLQFWSDRQKAFSEILRVLEPRGTAFIGRGFPPNMPPGEAARVRQKQGGGPSYSPRQSAEEFESIMRDLGIGDYEIIMPEPDGAGETSYGVWVKFVKPSLIRVIEEPGRHRLYAMDTLLFAGTVERDPLTNPRTESAGLQSSESVISREEIDRQGAKTLVEAVQYVPGAWVESRGRKVKQFFSVRGQRYPYPDYAIAGIWQREFHELPYFFPAGDIEKIEVMRSSAALLSGLSGMNGVVNIIPRRMAPGEISLTSEYGSFDSYRVGAAAGGELGERFQYTLSAGRPGTEGPSGKHAAEGITHLRGSFYWNPTPNLSVTTHLMHLDGFRELERAIPPAGANFQSTQEEYDPFRATLATLNALYSADGGATTDFTFNAAERNHIFRDKSSEPAVEIPERDYEWSANLLQSIPFAENNVFRVGGLYNHWAAPNGKRFYVGRRCDLETWSAVLADEHSIGDLTIDAGLRWMRTYINEYGAFNIDGSASGFQNVEPISNQWEPGILTFNIGASLKAGARLTFYGNLSRGGVKARSGELDINFETPQTETRTKLDLGMKHILHKRVNLTAAIFHEVQDDAIVLSGQTEEVEGRILELYLNRDQDRTGLELEIRGLAFDGGVQLFGNFTAMRSRMDEDGRMVRNREIPRFISSAGVYWTEDFLDLSLLWKHVSGYESTRFVSGKPPVPQPLGNYQNVDVICGISLGSRPVYRMYLELRNLADDHYSTVVGYPDYGRRYTVGLNAVFR